MYASIADMTSRFGEAEMIRFSVAGGEIPDEILPARIEGALSDASHLIDSYLGRRYRTPIAAPTPELVRAACVLARFDLAHGEDREPTEQMRLARKDVIAWLERLADGGAVLDGAESTATVATKARWHDRLPAFSTPPNGGL